jgi:hypothetical protein
MHLLLERRSVCSRGVLACALWVLGVAGCAAQRSPESESAPNPPPSVPGVPASVQGSTALDEAEPATLAEAEAWLEKARADLDRLALNDASGGAAPAPAAAPTPAPAAPPRTEKRAADKAEEAASATQAPEKEPSPCETACKAFSSLMRASEAVCRLDSEGGQRCQRARQIQSDASRRVASCGCSK